MLRADDGLTLRYVYSNITADLSAPSPGWMCADLTGNIAISSIVVETDVNIGGGDPPQVTLGETVAAVNGLQVTVDGTFGFIVGWITSWFQDYFTGALEDAIAFAISSTFGGADLSSVVIVRSGCAK